MGRRRRARVRRRNLRAAALMAVLLVTASCSTAISGQPIGAGTSGSTPDASVTSTGDDGGHQITEPGAPATETGSDDPQTPTTGAPAGLERFYGQRLDWGSCASYATSDADVSAYSNPALKCARLTVPMDYAQPDGATITLAVVRQQATGDRIGSVVFNPGGPGASGVSIVATIAQYGVDPRLAQRFDFVGFDPRGVGASTPSIACQTDAQQDANRNANWPGFMPTRDAAEVDAANEYSKKFIADCVDTISKEGVDGTAFLAQLGTTNVAKDLDVLRAVLGDEQLTYVGWSYGTSIGTQYAEQFPGNVRAMILDGAVDPAVDSAEDSLEQTAAFQGAFENFAQWCAPRQHCPWTDAKDATARFQDLAQPLMDTPLPLTDGRRLDFIDAVIGVADALYSDSSWETLLAALDDFVHGSGDALMDLADEYNDRDSSGHYSRMLESFTAIRCMDSDRITDPAAQLELNKKLAAASPFQDNGQPPAAVFDVCAFWPVPPTMLPHVPDPKGLAPVLVVSTTGDPATPYQSGVNLAGYLGGRLLTIEGTRHTGYMLSGITCADDIGDDYLINLTLPDEGARCSS